MNVRPLHPIGAEVTGIDLSGQISVEMRRALCDEWLVEYGMLLFREQELDEAQQLRVARLFGTVDPEPAYRGAGISYVSNVAEGGYNPRGELGFHQDNNYASRPLGAVMLHGIEVLPEGAGGETLLSDGRLTYRLLPAEIQAKIEGLQVRHRERQRNTPGRGAVLLSGPDVLHADRPLAFRHPGAGSVSLMLSPRHVECIVGLPANESASLIDELVAYIGLPQTTYGHSWKRGDTIVWDNISFHHGRTDFDPKYRRHLRRIAIDRGGGNGRRSASPL